MDVWSEVRLRVLRQNRLVTAGAKYADRVSGFVEFNSQQRLARIGPRLAKSVATWRKCGKEYNDDGKKAHVDASLESEVDSIAVD
jgi:hypothetical protein